MVRSQCSVLEAAANRSNRRVQVAHRFNRHVQVAHRSNRRVQAARRFNRRVQAARRSNRRVRFLVMRGHLKTATGRASTGRRTIVLILTVIHTDMHTGAGTWV